MFRPNKGFVVETVDQERVELDLYSEEKFIQQDNFDDDEVDVIETVSVAKEIKETLYANVPEPLSLHFHSNMIEYEFV